VARAHEQLTPGQLVPGQVSLLQVCDEVVARIAASGVDVSVVHVDRIVGLVAAEQDAIVTWGQLRALGLGRGAIEHRVRRGLLHPLHRGVYRWGAPIDSAWSRARGAVLACGAGAAVTHHAALGLYGVRPHPASPIDVTVVGRRVRCSGIRSHRVDMLARADVRLIRGIAVTAPARSLLEPAFTRSRAERKLVSLLRAAGLPRPAFNARAEGFEVDALWRRERVVLEFDSYEFHATRAAFERDRRKTAALTRGRYVVLRTTWRELTEASHALIARTAQALALSATAPTGSPARAGP
jgi:very-short-patch-repair endonuclease